MRLRLRTLLIVAAIAPFILAGLGRLIFNVLYLWYRIGTDPDAFKGMQQ
jgi:hypothetical protein